MKRVKIAVIFAFLLLGLNLSAYAVKQQAVPFCFKIGSEAITVKVAKPSVTNVRLSHRDSHLGACKAAVSDEDDDKTVELPLGFRVCNGSGDGGRQIGIDAVGRISTGVTECVAAY